MPNFCCSGGAERVAVVFLDPCRRATELSFGTVVIMNAAPRKLTVVFSVTAIRLIAGPRANEILRHFRDSEEGRMITKSSGLLNDWLQARPVVVFCLSRLIGPACCSQTVIA